MFLSETLNFHTSPGNNSSQIVFLIHKPKYIAPQKVVHTCQLKCGGYTHTIRHELSVTEQNFQPL